MKKVFPLLMILFLLTPAFADRISKTTTVYTSTAGTLVKRGDARIHRILFMATANSGSFAIYDALNSYTESSIKAEGSEATSRNGKPYDFSNEPLELSTGLYLVVNTGAVVLTYE